MNFDWAAQGGKQNLDDKPPDGSNKIFVNVIEADNVKPKQDLLAAR
jgi:hypothetical protein